MTTLTGETKSFRPAVLEGFSRLDPLEDDTGLIDLFSGALLLINRDLEVVKANAAALRRAPVTRLRDGFIRLLGQDETTDSRRLRLQAREALGGRGKTVFLLHPKDSEPLICSITPMPGGGAVKAMVGLTEMVGGTEQVAPHLRAIYRLSQAEGEIAAAAASGLDLAEIAKQRGISIHTLRAQISAIKTKMGLSRMTEIAAVVGRIAAVATWL